MVYSVKTSDKQGMQGMREIKMVYLVCLVFSVYLVYLVHLVISFLWPVAPHGTLQPTDD
jgi:hypothetical protein